MDNGEIEHADPSRARLLRVVAVASAVVLGVLSVVLVVFADSQKQVQVGVLLGLWAGLIAAFVAFGSRRTLAEVDAVRTSLESQVAELRETQITLAQVQTAQASQAIELRQRVEEARTSQIFDPGMLRQELNRLLTEQIGSLRDEIAGLRADMVDKLGTQIRLERIETTRVVGSDLEAIQREIRKLTINQNRTIESSRSVREQVVVEPIATRSLPADAATVQPATSSDVADAVAVGGTGTPAAADSAEAQATSDEVVTADVVDTSGEMVEAGGEVDEATAGIDEASSAEAVRSDAARPEPARTEAGRPQPTRREPATDERPPADPADVFANLPRLSRMPAELADMLLRDEPVSAPEPATEARPESRSGDRAAAAPAGADGSASRPYVGRRRASDGSADARQPEDATDGTEASDEPEAAETAESGGGSTLGGRRRAPNGEQPHPLASRR